MQKYKYSLVLFIAILFFSSCTPKLGGADREVMSKDEQDKLITELHKAATQDEILYAENGVVVTGDYRLEVESWKLHELAQDYEKQHTFDYIISSSELAKSEGDWMFDEVTTKDFVSTVRLYGDDDSMTLEVKILNEVGKYIIAPQYCIFNGVLKNNSLFKVRETEAGTFLITAQMSAFDELELFDLTLDNVSSIAWFLTAINTDTKQMNNFLLASKFPDDLSWEGIRVASNFEADSGIIMWVMAKEDSSYLCVFNGSNTQISSDVDVFVEKGQLISNTFNLEVSSGELAYLKIGFNTSGVTVKDGNNILFTE